MTLHPSMGWAVAGPRRECAGVNAEGSSTIARLSTTDNRMHDNKNIVRFRPLEQPSQRAEPKTKLLLYSTRVRIFGVDEFLPEFFGDCCAGFVDRR